MDALNQSIATIDSRLQHADYINIDEIDQITHQMPTDSDLERMQLQLAQLQSMNPSEEVVGRFETNLNAAKAAVAEHKRHIADKQARISQLTALDSRFDQLQQQLNSLANKPARSEEECRQDMDILKVIQINIIDIITITVNV